MRTIQQLAIVFAVACVPAGSVLAQNSPPSAAPPAVGVMLSSGQVLLWDEARGEYALLPPSHPASSPTASPQATAVPPAQLAAPPVQPPGPSAPVGAPTVVVPPTEANAPPALGAGAALTAPFAQLSPSAPVAAPPAPIDGLSRPVAPPPPAVPPIPVAPDPITAPPPPALTPRDPFPPADAMAPPPLTDPGVVPPSDPTPAIAAPPSAAPPASASPAEQMPMVLRRADLDDRLGNFERLAEDLSIAEVPGAGYQLVSLRPDSYLAQLGLRPGDILLSVDGRPILGPDDAARAYAWLQVADNFRLDLFRNGERVTLRYRVTG